MPQDFADSISGARSLDHPTLFYDGTCGLCDRTVRWLLRADHRGVLRFAALQGQTAQRRLPEPLIRDLDSLVLADGERVLVRSDAVLEALAHLEGWRWVARLLRIIPRPLRDRLYTAVARRRYRWFGRMDQCRAPAPEVRARFLV